MQGGREGETMAEDRKEVKNKEKKQKTSEGE